MNPFLVLFLNKERLKKCLTWKNSCIYLIFWMFHSSTSCLFFFQYSKDILSVLIVYRPGEGNQLLEVSPNYVKENIEGNFQN